MDTDGRAAAKGASKCHGLGSGVRTGEQEHADHNGGNAEGATDGVSTVFSRQGSNRGR